MLRVSIHAGPLDKASRFNLVAWLDIAYERLAPVANYKTVLYQSGLGATLPIHLEQYPRWSASLWDLTARAIALGLSPDQDNPTVAVPPVSPGGQRPAFARQICALIEHTPGTGTNRRTLGSVEVTQAGRTRCLYGARFDEHTAPRKTIEPFEFAPAFMRPAELLLHACLMRLTGTQEMPPWPMLCVPTPFVMDGLEYVAIHDLVEPARTGFVGWLHKFSEPPVEHESAYMGIAPSTLYDKFLSEAV